MSQAPDSRKTEPTERMHLFTVSRGMTPAWYLGLLQAALARVTLEGQN